MEIPDFPSSLFRHIFHSFHLLCYRKLCYDPAAVSADWLKSLSGSSGNAKASGGAIGSNIVNPQSISVIGVCSLDGGENGAGVPKADFHHSRQELIAVEHVMLADDDPDDREFFLETLYSLLADVKVSVLEDGQELMEELSGLKLLPDLLFLDLNMPKVNGFECMKKIRDNSNMKHLRVIILSTSGDRQTIDYLYRLGADAFIQKPLQFSSWRPLLEKALSRNFTGARLTRKNFLIRE